MKPPETVTLTPGKRVLFLTKDPELIRRQLRGELDLQMKDLRVEDLLDDINTDAMTPAWVCFDYKPEDIARNAYAGLIVNGERLFPADALRKGDFEVIVSGYRKGVGSSRETATQCEVFSGIRIAIAASFAPIHAGNNINQGLLMGDHDMLVRLQAGEGVALREFCEGAGRPCPDFAELLRDVRRAAPEIIERKGFTSVAIASCVARICEAVLRDEHSVLPVSTLTTGQYGIRDVYLSLPCVIGRGGVERVVEIPLDAEELAGLRAAAETLRRTTADLRGKL